jgi:hypothetical protein
MMNPQDAEGLDAEQQKREEELREERLDDMGVLVLSDECDQIEEVIRIFKYLTIGSIVIVIAAVTGVYVSRQF